jgi:putative PIN family toxin of toxin-antitoxin system
MVSEEIVGEISQTLAYPRLRQVYANSGATRQELIETVLQIGKLLEVTKRLNVIREDPADNKFIECAAAGEADYLVSGDKHLLKIDRYQKTRILPVREFLKVLETKKPLV